MSTDQDLDFTTSNIPDSWHAAAGQAPGGGLSSAGHGGERMRRMPSRSSLDLFSAALAGTVGSGLLGLGWWYLESSGLLIAPWLALAVGATLALLVRAGGGADDPGTRAIVSVVFYLVTSSTVIVLVAREVFAAAYGSDPGLAEFEQSLLHSRFAEPLAVVCWVGGAVVAAQLSRLLRRRG